MIRSRGEKAFQVFNYTFLILLSLLMIYPFWNVIRVSLSTSAEVSRMGFYLWPREVSLLGYDFVLKNKFLWIGYANTGIRIIIGMAIQMTLMVFTALTYEVNHRQLHKRHGI